MLDSEPGADLRRTPLHDRHRAAGARLVAFAGFEMPLQYTGVLDEHRAVRSAAGLFDVSHMGEFEVSGPRAVEGVERLVPSAIGSLEVGRARYTALTTPEGTFVDDILVYRTGDDRLMLVVNAANRATDLAWIREHLPAEGAVVTDVSDETALLAIQGPRARQITARIAVGFDALAVKRFRFARGEIGGVSVLASRTGYTGEAGFELYCSSGDAPRLWDALLEAGGGDGLVPAGLGARDTLRLEAGLPLYGQDIDRTTTVLEAALEFIIDWERGGEFIGRSALERQRAEGVTRIRHGFVVTGRGIARAGAGVFAEGRRVGTVTSGSFAPSLGCGAGMAYLPPELAGQAAPLEIDVRGRRLPARAHPLPLYRRRRAPGAGG